MLGILGGKLFLTGKERNVIKAKNQNENDSVWYRLKFSDGARDFSCTCAEKFKTEVVSGKPMVEFDVSNLTLFKQYDITVDIEYVSGYPKVKLRTFKDI